MNTHITMAITTLEVLKDIEAQWTEFRRKVAELAPRFKTITAEEEFKTVFEDLLELCQEYPLLWMLLNQQSNSAGSKAPPSPEQAPKFNPKEIANKYYSLLVKLDASELPREEADDSGTDA